MNNSISKKTFETIRPDSYRAISAKTYNSRESRIYTRELEARNKILKNKFKGPRAEKNQQLYQLKQLIAEEEEMLINQDK